MIPIVLALPGPPAAAAAELLHLLVIDAVVLAAVVGVTLVGLCCVPGEPQMSRHATAGIPGHAGTAQTVSVALRAAAGACNKRVFCCTREAIEAPRQVHLHFHGVDPADVAELIRRQQEGQAVMTPPA